ncbi:MAG: diguanylate cyclase [Rhodoferax sp.]|nr:diguanylate cyclase [Rhodoferax sp.]
MNNDPTTYSAVRSDDGRKQPALIDHIMVLAIYLSLAVLTQSVFKTITVWPSAGVALAAFLVFGTRIWPSIALGTHLAVLAYFLETAQPLFSLANLAINLATVVGNTLAAAIALRICGRVDQHKDSFTQFDWVASRFLVAIFVFGLLSALPGVGVYWLVGQPWSIGYLTGIMSWVISDSVGALVITPLLVKLWVSGITAFHWQRLKVYLPISLGLFAMLWFIFGPGQAQLSLFFRQPSFILIPLVFVAVTCGQTFTFLLLALTFFAVWVGTSSGYGPFISSIDAITHASMQAFIGFSAIVILLLQALVAGQKNLRARWAEDLRQHNLQLEQVNASLEATVQERTQDLSQALEFSETILLDSPLAMGVYAANGQCVRANSAYATLVGATPQALLAQNFHGIDAWEKSGMLTDCRTALAHKTPAQGEIHVVTSFGKTVWVEYRSIPTHLKGEDHLLIQFVDLTQRKRMEEELRHIAFHDALTHLPNRRLLLDRLKQALRSAKRQNTLGAVLFLDLNKFKQLNDTHGHDVGDKLLVEVALRLQGVVRDCDTVARLGGDEFVVVLEGLGAEATEHASAVTHKILEALSAEYVLGDVRHHGSASIGLKLFSGADDDPDQIIKEADAAMYEAKKRES